MNGSISKIIAKCGASKEDLKQMQFKERKNIAENYMYPERKKMFEEHYRHTNDLIVLYDEIEKSKVQKINKTLNTHFDWIRDEFFLNKLFTILSSVKYKLIENDWNIFRSIFSINGITLPSDKRKVKWINENKNTVQIAHLFHELLDKKNINRLQVRKINAIIQNRICDSNGDSDFLKNLPKTYSRFTKNPPKAKSEDIRDIETIVSLLV